ncbi:hypothetical protein BD560DRAFT_409799 [Blakeslea trispora]|nr:hypothetical protein BD560DRAFT_409799 [Blakeslea trispora]
MDSSLSIKNASGKTFSLLNQPETENNTMIFKVNKMKSSIHLPTTPKRKYHCSEPGCNKSFTTSGHLARHNRIHTGEKNFHCLHPGCPSRFSRQDNMMQHYRTHLTQKLRRQNMRHSQAQQFYPSSKGEWIEENRPQLYCHSYHERENQMSLQPLINRPRRSVTMPSLPYPNTMVMEQRNRPRRALSTSSDCSSDSYKPSFQHLSCSPHSASLPPLSSLQPGHILPPPPASTIPFHHYEPHLNEHKPPQAKPGQSEWTPNSQKSLSGLLHLANIVSTFG